MRVRRFGGQHGRTAPYDSSVLENLRVCLSRRGPFTHGWGWLRCGRVQTAFGVESGPECWGGGGGEGGVTGGWKCGWG